MRGIIEHHGDPVAAGSCDQWRGQALEITIAGRHLAAIRPGRFQPDLQGVHRAGGQHLLQHGGERGRLREAWRGQQIERAGRRIGRWGHGSEGSCGDGQSATYHAAACCAVAGSEARQVEGLALNGIPQNCQRSRLALFGSLDDLAGVLELNLSRGNIG